LAGVQACADRVQAGQLLRRELIAARGIGTRWLISTDVPNQRNWVSPQSALGCTLTRIQVEWARYAA
jgi:hypothetical protein